MTCFFYSLFYDFSLLLLFTNYIIIKFFLMPRLLWYFFQIIFSLKKYVIFQKFDLFFTALVLGKKLIENEIVHYMLILNII